ncbi:MAG: hypothetical protein ABUT20_48205, partial [Bacteroidota bacterium]
GGKSPTHYYSFHFRNFENEFRLEDNIYKYGKWKIYRDDFIPGDTLSVQIKQKYAERLSGDKKIYLVNVFVSGKWLIDHMDRNEAIKENDKKGFLICVVGFVLSCIGILVWNKFKN